MPAAGVHIVPLMTADDVIAAACEAERTGYDYCLVADEGFHPDVYACLGAIARATDRIAIGAVTNPYTRHPAATATAMATVNELSGGRAFVTLLAGGSMVLAPMGLARPRPYRYVSEAVEVMHRLWSGEPVSWHGEVFALDQARLGLGKQAIPLWIAGRGPLLLGLAGRQADGVLLTVKPDLGAAMALVEVAADEVGRAHPTRSYLGRICFTPQMLADQRATLSYVLMDSPRRVLDSLGLDDAACDLVARAVAENQPGLVDGLVTDDLLRQYQIAGSPHECAVEVAHLAERHQLDAVFVDVLSPDPDENLRVIHGSYPIICPEGSASP